MRTTKLQIWLPGHPHHGEAAAAEGGDRRCVRPPVPPRHRVALSPQPSCSPGRAEDPLLTNSSPAPPPARSANSTPSLLRRASPGRPNKKETFPWKRGVGWGCRSVFSPPSSSAPPGLDADACAEGQSPSPNVGAHRATRKNTHLQGRRRQQHPRRQLAQTAPTSLALPRAGRMHPPPLRSGGQAVFQKPPFSKRLVLITPSPLNTTPPPISLPWLTSEGVLFRSSKWILFFMSMSLIQQEARSVSLRRAAPGWAPSFVLTPMEQASDPPSRPPRPKPAREAKRDFERSTSSARNPPNAASQRAH